MVKDRGMEELLHLAAVEIADKGLEEGLSTYEILWAKFGYPETDFNEPESVRGALLEAAMVIGDSPEMIENYMGMYRKLEERARRSLPSDLPLASRIRATTNLLVGSYIGGASKLL